jgi:hypothetical protein
MLLTMATGQILARSGNHGSGVMRSTILIGLVFFVMASTAWTVDLVSYHPKPLNGIDPLGPLTVKIALN